MNIQTKNILLISTAIFTLIFNTLSYCSPISNSTPYNKVKQSILNLFPASFEKLAVHESGHAILAFILGSKIHKLTINPDDPKYEGFLRFTSKTDVEYILILFGGYLAEENEYGFATCNNTDDINKINDTIKTMAKKTKQSTTELFNTYESVAKQILIDNKHLLLAMKKEIYARKTMSGQEVIDFLNNIKNQTKN